MAKRFERSQLTQSLVNYLALYDKGANVSYLDLGKQVGQPMNAHEHHLIFARHVLEREFNAIWTCVKPNLGLHRLTDPEIAEQLSRWWMRGARRKLSRGGDQVEIVETDQLDINQQSRFSIDCIQRELAFSSLSKATRQRMEKVARGSSNDLPSFNILEWAISLSPRKSQQTS